MPACTSTMDERLSWIKSVDTTWSSVTPKIPCKECSKRYKDFCEQPDCVTSFSKCHNVVGLELATTQEKPWSHRGLAMHVQTVCSATDIVGQYQTNRELSKQRAPIQAVSHGPSIHSADESLVSTDSGNQATAHDKQISLCTAMQAKFWNTHRQQDKRQAVCLATMCEFYQSASATSKSA